jgi:ElaB/YqjD/DUF883 family membrane-anchored ribosome-binding protein
MAKIASKAAAAAEGIQATDKLVADLREVASDAEELLSLTAGQAGERLADVRARLGERLSTLKEQLFDLEAEMVERGKQVARATDDYVHDNPWKSIGATAGVAFLLGLLIGRR